MIIMIVYVLWKRIHNQLGIQILESRFPIRDYKFSNPESQDRQTHPAPVLECLQVQTYVDTSNTYRFVLRNIGTIVQCCLRVWQ